MPSGVYLFKDQGGKVIYVGKAIDLKKRVASYFSKSYRDVKTLSLIKQIVSVETIPVESELEALILEANLIKRYLPRFNVRLTDDKDYLYIGISKANYPKVVTIRRKDLKKVKKYFGPFPSARTVRETLKLLRRVFPWCANPPKAKMRACFYYHLGLCPGACLGLIDKHDYNRIINRFTKFLEGKKQKLLQELTKEMEERAKDQRYEEASRLKKVFDGISYLTQPNRVQFYLETPNFLQEETRLAVEQLQKDLGLPKPPQRIEAYDISNIGGKDATGSMVVLTNGEIDKPQYRKFKIHMAGKPDDVGMMREIIRRRLTHPEWPVPNLILVDGGRAQVNAVNYQLQIPRSSGQVTNYQLPVYGLAKRMEWLYPPQGDVIKLPKRSLSLKLLQKIRDEAHRFAVSYHRKLRDMMIFRS